MAQEGIAVPRGRLGDIEVLRGVAILMVFVQHLPFVFPWRSSLIDFYTMYWHGAAGVDLFFAISGFVIARGLLPQLDRADGPAATRATLLTFFARRFWRLQPTAWYWAIMPVLLSLCFNRSGAFDTVQDNLSCGLSAMLGFNNIRVAMFGYAFKHLGVNSVFWSLSLEEQFYLLFPIAALLLRRRLAWLMALLIAYQFTMSPAPIFNDTRPGALAVGVLLAIWSRQPGYPIALPTFLGRGPIVRAAFLFGLVAVLGALPSALPYPLFSIPYGIVAVLAGVLVYAASFDRGYIAGKGLFQNAMMWLGARSYAIYLTHMPAFALTREIYFRLHPPPVTPSLHVAWHYVAVGVVLTFALAEMNYRLIEAPGRRFGRSVHFRRLEVA